MRVEKRAAAFVLILLMLLWVGTGTAQTKMESIKADAYVLMDADSGSILEGFNQDKRLAPASMTKLMTLILAVEALEDGQVQLTDNVVTSDNAWMMGGSQIYLAPGETMSYEDMLISIAVGSANDACVAVAEHLEGTHQSFVDKMNQKATELGLQNTQFINSYGLPAEGHYTSAHDMAIIARHALAHPRILEYSSIKQYNLREGKFVLYNTNKLLWWYEGTDGFKTGWTNEAKYCLTSTVKRDGLRLIAVVMASPEVRGHFRDSMELYNYGFSKYAYKSFFARDSVCGVVQVGKGVEDSVEAVALDDVGSIYLKGEKDNLSQTQQLIEYVDAPVSKGQKVGEMQVLEDGNVVKTVDIVSAKDVPKGGVLREIKKMFAETFLL
ncbi:MAG: D-alanyl-D-alanine carboxypeptidase [Syntrophomonadaceae bacterium]|nr:D-alanyl-D-alanine carboxypeptidase [Syntrophomonadaceae bacterium]